MKLIRVLTATVICACFGMPTHPADATTWYVDGAVASSGDGRSWGTAWKNITNIAGVVAGDIIYVSGGPKGSQQTYSLSANWQPPLGSSAGRITVQIGQDSAHNGTAVFDAGSNAFIYVGGLAYFNFSGDAGDGAKHFRIAGTGRVLNTTYAAAHDIHFSYVDCGSRPSAYFYLGAPCYRIELDHTYAYKLDEGSSDNVDDRIWFSQIAPLTEAFDDTLVHDNIWYCPALPNGFGDDYMKGMGDGISVYNNRFITYQENYLGHQHQDGLQPLSGSYLKVYGNYFENISNYAVFGDAYYGDFAHFYVCNNIVALRGSLGASIESANPQGIAIGPDGGSFSHLGRWPTLTDIRINNNVVLDYATRAAWNLYNVGSEQSQFIGCQVVGNTAINSGAGHTDPAVYTANNLVVPSLPP